MSVRRLRGGFSGSRDGMTRSQKQAFIEWVARTPMSEWHYGCCRGADTEALWLLVELGGGGVIHAHPATLGPTWDAKNVVLPTEEDIEALGIVMHEPKHPLARNKDIVRSSDVLFAAPAPTSRGTYATIDFARRMNIAVIEADAGVTDE